MTFGDKLSKLRKEANYTQEQFAELLGVSRQSVSKWESGVTYPETEKLVRIAKLFSCSVDYLLGESNEESVFPTERKQSFFYDFKIRIPERKSEKTVFGMPLYHIGKNAKGFFAIGWRAQGVFSVGLMAKGFFSLGLISFGAISLAF